MTTRVLVLAASFAISGCSTLNEYGPVGKQSVRDAQGNVAGYKQMLRNGGTGEIAAQVRLFTPIRNETGELVGYEEQTQDGAIIRNLDGRRVGARFNDLRSRATNTRSNGITVIIGSLNAQRVPTVSAMPVTSQLVASLSAADLRAIR